MAKPNGGLGLDNDILLFETGNLADATIVCGDRTWKVHKVILGSRCKWFKAAFYGNMSEAKSGKVVLQEQDPELVDIMLRFIYAKDVDIHKLHDGKGLPALYVQLFRLADFFMLDGLENLAIRELKSHLNNVFDWPFDEDDGDWCPQWITETLDAVADALKDGATEPILRALLDFIENNCHSIFRFKHAGTLLDKLPGSAKDPLKNNIVRFLAKTAYKPQTRLSLAVLAAEHCSGEYDSIHNTADNVSCLVNVVMENGRYTFTTMDPKVEKQIYRLLWITPFAEYVKEMTSHPDSAIVMVEMQIRGRPCSFFTICFKECRDARLYVEGYCRANPKIKRETAQDFNLRAQMRNLRLLNLSIDSPIGH